MGKLVYREDEYIVIEDNYRPGQHIIINTKGQYKNHGHVKHLKTCKNMIKWIKQGTVPHSDYLRGAALRISLDDKYKARIRHKMEKDKQKPKFIRVQRGPAKMVR